MNIFLRKELNLDKQINSKKFEEYQQPQIVTEGRLKSSGCAGQRRLRTETPVLQSSSAIHFHNKRELLWLEPTQENMERYLDELNWEISDEIPSHLDEITARWGLVLGLEKRRKIHIYMGHLQEAAADAERIISLYPRGEDSQGTIDSGLQIDAFHYFAVGEEAKGYAALNGLAKEGSALAILFLKIKGKPIPNFEYISFHHPYQNPLIAEADLFCQGRYEEAIKKITTYLEKDSYFHARGDLLALRGVFKAMANDYEGAISDLDQTITSRYPYYSQRQLAVRGLIHCLNNDPEKAKADFGSIPYNRIPPKHLCGFFGEFNEFKWKALILEQSLGL